ncbi:glycosyltransferase [Sinorhizobium meliloti]|uniref:glycosyltransferase n=1 Tax=Rhizobium meliloti TaxID=382 RepID=UPI003D64663A
MDTDSVAFDDTKSVDAFVSFVDNEYIDGFLALLRSLVLNNPNIEQDYIILFDDLNAGNALKIKQLYNRIVFRKIDREPYTKFKKGFRANYLYEKAFFILDAFRISGYRRLLCLDTDMVIVGRIDDLFDLDVGLAACPQYFDSDGGRRLNSGVLVISPGALGADAWQKIVEIGESGDYELEKHDQGILSRIFGNSYYRLSPNYNSVKRRLKGKGVGKEVRVVHFTGALKPWHGSEVGYEKLQATWKQFDLSQEAFLSSAIRATSKVGNHTLCVFYAREFRNAFGYERGLAIASFAAFKSLGLLEEVGEWFAEEQVTSGQGLGSLYRCLGEIADYTDAQDGAAAMLAYALAIKRGADALEAAAQRLWVEGEVDLASDYAEAALDASPFARARRVLRRRVANSEQLAKQRELNSSGAIAHAAFYMAKQGNAGDIILPDTIRLAIDPARVDRWSPIHVHQKVRERDVNWINDQAGLVIGGGGLFLSDTGKNKSSGWQWNIEIETLRKIETPLAVFAVGYNRFPGQGEFAEIFNRHVELLVEKSAFFGLRNWGSIKAIREYLPQQLRNKVEYQPCPTTVLSYIMPEIFNYDVERNYVALNMAYDRENLRFGANYRMFLKEMATYIHGIRRDTKVVYFAHAVVDEQFVIDLARYEGISLQCVRLYDFSPEEIAAKYREPLLVIGMRGHAGLIPFGCHTPILSLVTHPKLRYFLEDVGMPENAIDLDDGFGEVLLSKSRRILSENAAEIRRVVDASAKLWDMTRANAEKVRKAFSLK